MATKKTDKSKNVKSKAGKKTAAKATAKAAKKAAPKVAKGPKVAKDAKAAPRHPKARVTAIHGDKGSLAKSLAQSLARADEDTGVIAERLRTASNMQLLR